MRTLLGFALLLGAALVPASSVAQTEPDPDHGPVPVRIDVIGHGEIIVLVADGSTKPCDSSDNHILFNRSIHAGESIKTESVTGTVCVDHTYGQFRQSEWAGPAILGAGRSAVSTERP